MALENLDDLEAAWAEFMYDRSGERGEWSQDQRWRADNPIKQGKLRTYYGDRSARPNEFDAAERGSPEKRMIEIVDALWDAKGAVEPEDPEPVPTATLINQAVYRGYSDVGDVPIWRTHGEQAKADDRMRIVDDPLGQRGKVMRVEVRSGDSSVAGSNAGERADVMASSSVIPMREGSIVAVSCPIMLPNEFQSNGSGWNVCFGGHDKDGGTQSPLQVEIRNGRELRFRVLGGTHTGGLGTWSFRVDLGPWMLERNRWYHFVYGNLFSYDSSKGRIVIMLDGQKLEDRRVANLYKDSYNYHKQGWYRVAQQYTTVLYFGDTHFWTAPTLDAAVAAASKAGA